MSSVALYLLHLRLGGALVDSLHVCMCFIFIASRQDEVANIRAKFPLKVPVSERLLCEIYITLHQMYLFTSSNFLVVVGYVYIH